MAGISGVLSKSKVNKHYLILESIQREGWTEKTMQISDCVSSSIS